MKACDGCIQNGEGVAKLKMKRQRTVCNTSFCFVEHLICIVDIGYIVLTSIFVNIVYCTV